jgi:hypothetical protein
MLWNVLDAFRRQGYSGVVKDFISFLAGAIFIEELLADDDAPPATHAAPPDEKTRSTGDPDDDADAH